MIAVAILGIGLIMVAAVFPVALVQHRESVAEARSIELVSKAESILRGRIDPGTLWTGVPSGVDSPWYLLPSTNLARGSSTWDWMPAGTTGNCYANIINGATAFIGASPGNGFGLYYRNRDPLTGNESLILDGRQRNPGLMGLDILGDRIAPFSTAGDRLSPFTDAEYTEAAQRFVWFGFYRRLSSGSVVYAAAICRHLGGQVFAQQLVPPVPTGPIIGTPRLETFPPQVDADAPARRVPVPWRVTVGHVPPITSKLLRNIASPEALGELAPPGSRIMIHGAPGPSAPPQLSLPAGRVLTVVNVIADRTGGQLNGIEVLEDISDIPHDGNVDGQNWFDVWVFPPPVVGGGGNNAVFGNTSPLIDWKFFL